MSRKVLNASHDLKMPGLHRHFVHFSNLDIDVEVKHIQLRLLVKLVIRKWGNPPALWSGQ
jgi:hypothetical protein